MSFTRIAAGHYTLGTATILDTYSPSGAPHTRAVTLTRDRWLVSGCGSPTRFDRLRDARAFAAAAQVKVAR